MTDSRLTGFHRQTIADRLVTLVDSGFIDQADARKLSGANGALTSEIADKMSENVVSVFGLPFSVAPNFLVNGKDYVVPMVVEEPSVVAGVSGAARLMRRAGGFTASSDEPILIGQVHLVDIDDLNQAIERLQSASTELLAFANDLNPNLVKRGGGARSIDFIRHDLSSGQVVLAVHIAVDTRDAMGANMVNTICEAVAPKLEELSGGRSSLKILSNLADHSLVTSRVEVSLSSLRVEGFTPEQVRDGIVLANDIAVADRYRAVTHNKGVMNGIDAVAIATGNDWRAIEASVHAYASRDGQYRSLTSWSVSESGDLVGELTVPLNVGIVGGSLQSNPAASIGLNLTGVSSSTELAELMCSVGLAQNFAALRALATSGIQKGHMSLHARSVAMVAGAGASDFDEVVRRLIESGEIKDWKAAEIIAELSAGEAEAPDSDTCGSGTASGKVILLGEHAAVYGRHVLALPINDAVTATCYATDSGTTVSVPDWGISKTRLAQADDWLQSVIGVLLRELGAQDSELDITVRSKLPMAMGLGSSAAVVAAVARSVADFLSLNFDDDAINAITFECEKISHGNPSGIDNTLAVFGKPILYRSQPTPIISSVDLSEIPPIVIASSGTRGITREQVSAVRVRYDALSKHYEYLFDQIDALSLDGAEALAAGDYEKLGAQMNLCHGLLNSIGVSTPELEKMVALARDGGAVGAKLTGGGGGGSIVALCPGSQDSVEQIMQSAGYQTLRIS